jgi:hypothetical protein
MDKELKEKALRAAIDAARLAKFHNHKVPIWQNNKVEYIDPEIVIAKCSESAPIDKTNPAYNSEDKKNKKS